jgi:hypothetical protein
MCNGLSNSSRIIAELKKEIEKEICLLLAKK